MAFEIEDIVYLKTDFDLCPRMIVKMEVSKTQTMFCLAHGSTNSWHYDFEFSKDKASLNKTVGFKNGHT